MGRSIEDFPGKQRQRSEPDRPEVRLRSGIDPEGERLEVLSNNRCFEDRRRQLNRIQSRRCVLRNGPMPLVTRWRCTLHRKLGIRRPLLRNALQPEPYRDADRVRQIDARRWRLEATEYESLSVAA